MTAFLLAIILTGLISLVLGIICDNIPMHYLSFEEKNGLYITGEGHDLENVWHDIEIRSKLS
ncbi:hypothetical protein J2128_002241 [Methanomicrobium sp. W14]|uniref:hypothetical protein n=1 Tax=Methanomicrobium sp. W14 TaxID=2817839 RepID=UPI001AE26B86|nr:hypothetical protein [Methanomicrobium sp. W14]MBP2134275.1 hypothetical protein [Methanomicrobium sp. W14]